MKRFIAIIILMVGFVLYPTPANAHNDPEGNFIADTCGGLPVTIFGTGDSDYIVGTSGNDVIATGADDDIVYGMGGNDRICGEGGNDQLFGKRGNDWLYGGDATDFLNGGKGDKDRCTRGDTVRKCEKRL